MDDTQQMVARINALAGRTNRSRSTLSRILFGNGKRLDEIEAGGSITMTTYRRAVEMLDGMESACARETGSAAA